MKKRTLVFLAVALLASVAACLSEANNPLNPSSILPAALSVDHDFTNGTYNPEWIMCIPGEFSAFTMRWTEIENAQYYEIRSSESPITTENWSDADVMAIIPAPSDTADVFVRVEVQEEPCIGCGLCEDACPKDAIVVQNGIAVIDYHKCTACGQCQDVCPVDAITGTRYGVNYFFGIRAFFGEGNPATDIAVSEGAQRLIYYNNHYTIDPTFDSCGYCHTDDESECYIINDYNHSTGDFCGYGCPVDAVWQDFDDVGSIPYMVYIDYDECINCGECLLECWNYTGLRSMKRRVVPAEWASDQPARP